MRNAERLRMLQKRRLQQLSRSKTMGGIIKKPKPVSPKPVEKPVEKKAVVPPPRPKIKITPVPFSGVVPQFTKVKKIMFVQATRGRPVKGFDAAVRITSNMRSGVPFTYYMSLDTDDPTLPQYLENAKKFDFINDIFIGENRGSVDATNAGAVKYNGEDLVIVSGDDMAIRQIGWDVYVLDFIEKNISVDEYLVHFPDETENSKFIAIYQVLSGAFYKKQGYIFYPDYISMYADNDLWASAKQLGVMYNYTTPPNPLLFYHDHPGLGGSMEWDDTYRRTNDHSCYVAGETLYKKREQQGFPIKEK